MKYIFLSIIVSFGGPDTSSQTSQIVDSKESCDKLRDLVVQVPDSRTSSVSKYASHGTTLTVFCSPAQ